MVIIDAHSDYALHVYREHLKGNKNVLKEEHLPFLKKGGVNIEVLTVGGDFDLFPEYDSQDFIAITKVIKSIHAEISENPDLFILIKNSNDLKRIEDIKIGFILALEGSSSIDPDLSNLQTYHELGVRSIGLTHNKRNRFADGCAETPARGLTDLGKKFVSELNKFNILVDFSHTSEPSFWDALKILEKPPIVTHSNAKSLCNHARNLTDDQIKAIAKRNGVIGMNFFSTFIDETKNGATLDRLIDHIDYIVDLVGIDHVGLGPDFLNYYIKDLKELDALLSNPFDDSSEAESSFEIINDVSGFPQLFESIQKRGYSDKEVRKIQGDNFFRVFQEVL